MEEKEKGSLNKRRRKRERREEKGNQKGALKVVDALAARRSLPERTPLGVHRTVDDDRWVVVTRGWGSHSVHLPSHKADSTVLSSKIHKSWPCVMYEK